MNLSQFREVSHSCRLFRLRHNSVHGGVGRKGAGMAAGNCMRPSRCAQTERGPVSHHAERGKRVLAWSYSSPLGFSSSHPYLSPGCATPFLRVHKAPPSVRPAGSLVPFALGSRWPNHMSEWHGACLDYRRILIGGEERAC